MKNIKKFQQNQGSTFQIRITQQKQQIQSLFSQFNDDLKNYKNQKPVEDKNFLSTTQKIQRRPSVVKNKDKKRMKLIDYIYIKNSSKKNQKTSKIDKTTMTATELKKSRLKEGKQQAYKSIVQQTVKQLKEISAKASSLSRIAAQSFVYSGNNDEIAKLCSIRRILKEGILQNFREVQKLMGAQNNMVDVMSRQKINEQEQDEFEAKLNRLQRLGVKRLESDFESNGMYSQKCLTQRGSHKLKVANKLSQKDTQISQRQTSEHSYR